MLYAVLWLACVFIAMAMADRKGHGGCAGAIFGLLLGPIGVLIVGVWPARRNRVAQEEGRTKKCPACAELVQPDAVKCRFCGTDIGPASNPPGAHYG